jgi:hypothetical protein
VHATFSNGVLHLEKNCPTSTNAPAGADIMALDFDAATIASGGNQVPVPTGVIVSISVLIDVEGTADLMDITVNGELQEPATPVTKDDCKNGSWQTFVAPRRTAKRS